MGTRERVYKLIDTLDEEKLKALLLLFDNNNDNNIEIKSDNQVEELMGIFSDYANPELIPLEEGAWERAVVEKHENS